MGEEKCADCGEPAECETVHNGVGLLYGPSYCPSCGWSEYADAGKVIDGYYHDIAGGATPIPRRGAPKAEMAGREG